MPYKRMTMFKVDIFCRPVENNTYHNYSIQTDNENPLFFIVIKPDGKKMYNKFNTVAAAKQAIDLFYTFGNAP